MTTIANVPLEYVETPSGNFVSMVRPSFDDITLYDIAHKLSLINRFGGSTQYPYSVAQHAVFVSERLRRQGYSRRIQLEGLHHDDPEAFLMDIPRPWKALLGDVYKRMTELFEEAIMVALDLPGVTDEEHVIIKGADNFALVVEARNLLKSGGRRWDYVRDLGLPERVVTPNYFMGEQRWADARDAYLRRHEELTNGPR